MKSRVQYLVWAAVAILAFGYAYVRAAHKAIGWPIAIVLGLGFGVLVFSAIGRRSALPPFRLMLRLANDKTGKSEDAELFGKLHARFKSQVRGKDLKFGGFDASDTYLCFYFSGNNPVMVRDAVLSLVSDCKFREGSYFEISENERRPLAGALK